MLKFIFCQKSIWLIFIIILHCTASPAKGESGGKSTKASPPKGQKGRKAATASGQDDEQLLVKTDCGDVKGTWKFTSSEDPKKFRSFKAIPYAETLTDRTKAPQKKKPWSKPLVTTDDYGACCIETPQEETSQKTRSENCLFLNIFTPADIPKDKKLPFIFFEPKGGCGDDKCCKPDPIMEKGDTIMVSINFRAVTTGSIGLKDRQMALQWVNNNIAAFGGDPKLCTAVTN